MDTPTTTAVEARQLYVDSLVELGRTGRDALLAKTDYIFNPDVTVSQEYKDALVVYRQELRDFPEGFRTTLMSMDDTALYSVTPQSIIYPVKPVA